MKKTLVIVTTNLFLICFAFMVSLISPQIIGESLAYTPGAGINGSPHDFSAMVGAELAKGGYDRACIFCHSPTDKADAGSSRASGYFALWDVGAGTKRFISYNSGTARGKGSAAELLSAQPGRLSRFCLGCHDGTHAPNNYGRASIDSRSIAKITGTSSAKVIGAGGNLSNHHPIGFDYELVRSVNRFIAPDSYAIGRYAISDLLDNGKMECTTCHSVHNTGNTGEKLLWISDRRSEFCLSCHMLA